MSDFKLPGDWLEKYVKIVQDMTNSQIQKIMEDVFIYGGASISYYDPNLYGYYPPLTPVTSPTTNPGRVAAGPHPVYQLGDNSYQVNINGRAYVGTMDFMVECMTDNGIAVYETVGIAGTPTANAYHDCVYVEVGFMHSKLACKICDRDKPVY